MVKHRFTEHDWVEHGEGKAKYVSAEQAVYGKDLNDRYMNHQKRNDPGTWLGEPRWDVAEGWYYIHLGGPSVYGPFAAQAECGTGGPRVA